MQGVLHLHGLDDGDPLAARHGRALFHQNGEHLAVHRRAHQPAGAGIRGLVEHEVAQGHFGLAAGAQHVDGVIGRDRDRAGRRRLAIDGHHRTGRAVAHLRRHGLAVGDHRQQQRAGAGKLEGVVGVPRRGGGVRDGKTRALARQQLLRAERRGRLVEALRGGAQRAEMAVDEAGVEFAAAKVRRARQRRKEPGVAARAGDHGGVQRFRQAIERSVPGRAMRDHLGDHRVVERRHRVAGLDA